MFTYNGMFWLSCYRRSRSRYGRCHDLCHSSRRSVRSTHAPSGCRSSASSPLNSQSWAAAATAATVATATVAATARDADQVVADADAEEEEVLGEGRLPHSRNERIQTHRHTNAQTTQQTTRLLLARLSHRSHCCSHQPHRLLTSLALPLLASLAIAAACQAGGAGAGCAVTTQHFRRVRAGDAASRPNARGQGPI